MIQKRSQAACAAMSFSGPAAPPNKAPEKPTPKNGLAAARPAWQFVDAFNRLAQVDDCAAELRADAYRALSRLNERGWPQDADPARFPNASERSDLLERALF